jgi:DNA-directed RNA polymerase specialized sigma24 family protein
VTNNKIRDWFKTEKRENKIFAGDLPSEEIAAASAEYLLENEELGKLLRACLKNLEPKTSRMRSTTKATCRKRLNFMKKP